jgi:ankyrin repeat protein
MSRRGAHGNTALHLAAQHHRTDALQVLCRKLAEGGDRAHVLSYLFAENDRGEQAIHVAARCSNLPAVAFLVARVR